MSADTKTPEAVAARTDGDGLTRETSPSRVTCARCSSKPPAFSASVRLRGMERKHVWSAATKNMVKAVICRASALRRPRST